MLRDIDQEQISPDRLKSSKDLVSLVCDGCEGCSSCCRDRGSVIVLDEYDVRLLKAHFGASFQDLLSSRLIGLSVIDGVVLPHLNTKSSLDECVFLNTEGRCAIHNARPGICRMFPLGRIWHDDGSFSYFLQEGECPASKKAKIRISKWLGYDNMKEYEASARSYHDALKALRERCATAPAEEAASLQTEFLKEHFE